MKWVFFLVLPLWDYFKTRSSQKLSRASLHRLSLWPHRPHIQLFSYNLSSVLILENALHATAPGLLHLQFPSVWNILSLGSHRFATSPSSGHYLSAIFQDHPILNHKPSLRGMPILPSCSVFFISLIFLCLLIVCLQIECMLHLNRCCYLFHLVLYPQNCACHTIGTPYMFVEWVIVNFPFSYQRRGSKVPT